METTETSVEQFRDSSAIVRAAGVGLLAGVAFGLMIQFGLDKMGAIGAMYTLGTPSLSVGWVAHLGHSVLFGALYGLVVDRETFDDVATAPATGLGVGLAFGVALWAVNIVFLWPLWLSSVGLSAAPSAPNLAVMPLAGHLVYGAILGAGYALVR